MNLKDIIAALLTTKGNATGLTKGGISTAFSLLSKGTKAFLGIGTALTAVSIAYTVYKKRQQELINNMQEVTSSWSEANNTLQEQISKYKELKSQLDSGTLSSSEEYEIKQQILDIQTQITSQYGNQVDNIDLVNGGLQTQLGILQQISADLNDPPKMVHRSTQKRKEV